jgi:hypothetical protein
LAVLLGAANLDAQAAGEPEPVRASVEFRAPPDCGSRADLVARITRRSDRIRIEDASAPRRLEVEITPDGAQLVATLALEQASGRRSSRTLRAPSCDEALEAIALVAALSLDPTASTAPEQELPITPAPSTVQAPAPSDERAPSVPEEPPASTAERIAFGGSVTLAGQALFGPAPAALPGIGFSLSGRIDRPSVVAPVLRLGYAHSVRGGFAPEEGVGTASFVLDAGTLEACPLRVGTRVVSVLPCALVSGGRLRVSGSEALLAQSHSRPWWVAGGSLLGLLRPVGLLEVQASFSVGIPLIRDVFQFAPAAPGHVVHSVPGVAYGVGLGAGLAFP